MKAIGYQTIFRKDHNCEAIYVHFNYITCTWLNKEFSRDSNKYIPSCLKFVIVSGSQFITLCIK